VRLTLIQQRALAALRERPRSTAELVDVIARDGLGEVLLPWVATALKRLEAGELVRRAGDAWEVTEAGAAAATRRAVR
jgi:predicted MarR family transcription regulator